MEPVCITEGVYWVGGIDWNLRSFHGYLTQRGSTYNAYLIIDKEITLIDTVKHYLTEEMLSRISKVIDPSNITKIVSNHVEMDHSGGLPAVMERCPDAEIITSVKGEAGLKLHYKKNWNFSAVKTGDTVSLGKRSLTFVATPMVHWPDNMVTVCPEEKILFSNDAFGQHLASSERFDDEFPLHITLEEAQKYYANIVLPYSKQVQKALEALSGLDIRLIAPSHGLMWRSNISEILAEYAMWSGNETENKAVIVYDSMWGSTETVARALYSGFRAKGVPAKLMNLQHNHISDVMTDIMTSKYICVGSPTLNNGMLPTVAGFLTYMKGLKPAGRTGLAFGSYGWGGQSISQVHEVLESCGWDMMEQIKVQYIPDEKTLTEIEDGLSTQL